MGKKNHSSTMIALSLSSGLIIPTPTPMVNVQNVVQKASVLIAAPQAEPDLLFPTTTTVSALISDDAKLGSRYSGGTDTLNLAEMCVICAASNQLRRTERHSQFSSCASCQQSCETALPVR